MEVRNAQDTYVRNQGKTDYRMVYHPGRSILSKQKSFGCGFYINLPIDFLRVDNRDGIIAFSRDMPEVKCRCGFVEKVYYYQVDKLGFMVCGVKIMDKNEIRNQGDDIEHEISVLKLLQPSGLLRDLNNPHFLRWQATKDRYNQYIIQEYASNGNLILYAHKKITQLVTDEARVLISRGIPKHIAIKQMSPKIGKMWMEEGINIFQGLMEGLDYMHRVAKVCHLDLDPNNLVIDRKGRVRIIDFGSSQIMKEDCIVVSGDHNPIKFKYHFTASEVRNNNRMSIPRKGFLGWAADMYSAGVILYQLVCWGYPGGEGCVVKSPNWMRYLSAHVKSEHTLNKQKNCYICCYNIDIPGYIYDILYKLLQVNPTDRWNAEQVLRRLNQARNGITGRIGIRTNKRPCIRTEQYIKTSLPKQYNETINLNDLSQSLSQVYDDDDGKLHTSVSQKADTCSSNEPQNHVRAA